MLWGKNKMLHKNTTLLFWICTKQWTTSQNNLGLHFTRSITTPKFFFDICFGDFKRETVNWCSTTLFCVSPMVLVCQSSPKGNRWMNQTILLSLAFTWIAFQYPSNVGYLTCLTWSKIEIWITHYTLNHSALQLSNETIFKKWFLNLFDFSRVIILNDLTKTSHLLTVVLQPKLFNSVPGTRNFGTYCTYHFSTVEINTKNHCDETFSEPRSEHSDAHDVSNILQSASIKQ